VTTIEVEHVSRWYGNVVAVNDVTMRVEPGVTGLLGPNGAGKSTLIHMISGFLEPSMGTVEVAGRPAWHDHELYRVIGLVPERDAVYGYLTARQLTLASARLHSLPRPVEAAERALSTVDLTAAADRRIDTYSKGMRQRAKVAAALVHEPEVLVLDEPFNGMDPRQRLHMMDLVRRMGAEGRTVLFSSHILEEVERVAEHIQVIIAGRLAASGDFREIRRLMTDRPHVFTIRSSDDRRLATALIADGSTTGVEVGDDGLRVHAADFARFTWLVPQEARRLDIGLREVRPADESLESVFSYLVAQ
jgi:ABC-2 type transport system ATP-binding protein